MNNQNPDNNENTENKQNENTETIVDTGPAVQGRERFFIHHMPGIYRRRKDIVLYITMLLVVVVPWIRWDRGEGIPDQAFLLDIRHSTGYIFDLIFYPQDAIYIIALLTFLAVLLFFATNLYGRIFCGYVCPHTMWTDLYQKIEYWVEGNRAKRLKLYNSPMSLNKVFKYCLKYFLFFAVAFYTGLGFLFFFNDPHLLIPELLSGQASNWMYSLLAINSGFSFLFGTVIREQVCIYMCPWGRFQGAMYSSETLIATYNEELSEPRGKGKKRDGLGHCVDCDLCVNVCPTNIDIRDGQQLACIGCGLCVDACKQMMTNLKKEVTLIEYTSFQNVQNRIDQNDQSLNTDKPFWQRVREPRNLIYIVVLTVIASVSLSSVFSRSAVNFRVLHDRAPIKAKLSNGDIRNGYTLNVDNVETKPTKATIYIVDDKNRKYMFSLNKNLNKKTAALEHKFDLPALSTSKFKLWVKDAPIADVKRKKLSFVVTIDGKKSIKVFDFFYY